MKKTYLYIVGCAAALMMIGCTKDAGVNVEAPGAPEAVSLKARVVEPEEARTTLGEDEDEGGYRQVLWATGDRLALIDDYNLVRPMDVDEGSVGVDAYGYLMFTGNANVNFYTKSYPIVYPYEMVESGSNSSINLTLPEVQTTIDGGESLMYGYTYSGENAVGYDMTIVDLFNMVGYLELQVVGEGAVDCITVTSASQKLSGAAVLTPSYEGPAELTVTGSHSVSLVPAEAVTLDASTATSFLVALPAGTYPAGDLTVSFSIGGDHKVCTSSQEHELVASMIKPLTMSATTSVEYVDLTAGEKYANAFVLPAAGWYKFEAKTRGGLTSVPHPKVADTVIATIGGEGAQACNAWESHENMVTNVIYNAADNTVRFYYDGQEGNSMICMVKDGLAQWTWHLWAVNDLDEQQIGENTYLDRNLGAWGKPADADDAHNYLQRDYNIGNGETYSSMGLMWQWGRPNAFPGLGRYHTRYSGWYQRETDGAVTFADLFVEAGATISQNTGDQLAKLGYTPIFYFPSPEIMGSLYKDNSGAADPFKDTDGTANYVPWFNKWGMTNNTTNITMAVALANPMRAYGTGAGTTSPTCNIKYWCNDLFTGSFDFASSYSPWNYGTDAQTSKTFDVCPYGYHIPDGAQTVADFSTLNFTWKNRYNNGATSADAFVSEGSTTRTLGAYATATDGSFVWVPGTGVRLHYGGGGDANTINWWCSSNNNQDVVIRWAADADYSKTPVVENGFYDLNGENGGHTRETVASLMLPIRCVKTK